MSDSREERGKLLSLAVHEFRTPVAVVAGYLRMLLRHFGDSLTEQQRKLIEESEKSCGQLTRLLSDLGELANIDGGQAKFRRERVALFELLRAAAAEVGEAGDDRGVRLQVETPEGEVQVQGDAGRLRAAFASLLAAVLRERAEPGVLTVRASLDGRLAGRVAVVAVGDAAQVSRLPGPDALDGNFDRYRGGMGFRLPLAAEVIAAHGGRVASPVTERGRLSIVFTLPVTAESEIAG